MISCKKKPTMDGLWLVKSVTVGKEEMTPNSRWMRFNSDSTQQSGNGWLQHSNGTWTLTQNKLKIENTNSLNDPFEAFDITFDDHKMTWKRIEDAQPVTVNLEKIAKLPLAYNDQLLGLWKLDKAVGNGSFFSETENSIDYLFFRWDKRFVIRNANGRHSGVYQVNGHKPQVTLFPYDESIERCNWEIMYEKNQITLKKLNVDSIVTRRFERIYDFPE